jgi:hypothetical protein
MEPLDWVGLFKRYVGNNLKTPYFVAVDRLTRAQANNEVFVYALCLTVLFGIVGVAALSPDLPSVTPWACRSMPFWSRPPPSYSATPRNQPRERSARALRLAY